MRSTRRLTLEALEARSLPAVTGALWPEPAVLSLSFAPDGTDAAGRPSALFRTLDASGPGWEEVVLRAFQTWAVETGTDIGLVPDGGQPFGTLGFKQGDLRFGDIRVGAVPMAEDTLAVANPYDPFVANTWVGDVFVNSSTRFARGGAGGYDLFTVALHEAGHVFGLGHSADAASPMYASFQSPRSGLTPADAAAIQVLYGRRLPDAFEGLTGNDTPAAATPLDPAVGEYRAGLTTAADVDTFRLTAPAGRTSLDVRLKAAGLSLLVGRLTVTDAAGRVVASAAASGPVDNDVGLHLTGLTPGGTYFVRVDAARHDVFAVGGYELLVDLTGGTGPGAIPQQVPPDAQGGELLATTPGYVEHTYYEVERTLTAAVPSRTFRARSADLGQGLTNVMTVVVRSEYGDTAKFHTSVTDAGGRPVAYRVVADGPDGYEIQVFGVESDADYLVRVSTDDFGPGGAAEYELEVDFAQDGTHLESYVSDSIPAGQTELLRTLVVTRSQQFHFVLGTSDWGDMAETGLRMDVLDAAGRTVFSTTAPDGGVRTADVFLDAGEYTVRFARATPGAGGRLLVQLGGLVQSEPFGPQLRDTTLAPVSDEAVDLHAVTYFWLPYGAPAARPVSAAAAATRWPSAPGDAPPTLGISPPQASLGGVETIAPAHPAPRVVLPHPPAWPATGYAPSGVGNATTYGRTAATESPAPSGEPGLVARPRQTPPGRGGAGVSPAGDAPACDPVGAGEAIACGSTDSDAGVGPVGDPEGSGQGRWAWLTSFGVLLLGGVVRLAVSPGGGAVRSRVARRAKGEVSAAGELEPLRR
jgi:hypothetical protein